jgi:hypothetical protein
VEEELFACSKDELIPAINASKNTIDEFHGRLPRRRKITWSPASTDTRAAPVSLSFFIDEARGPGREKRMRRKRSLPFAGRLENQQLAAARRRR